MCDDSFNDNAADAVCREMGFDRSITWNSHTLWVMQSQYDIKLDDVTCSSGSWGSCSYAETHNCGHSEDVFVSCKGKIF